MRVCRASAGGASLKCALLSLVAGGAAAGDGRGDMQPQKLWPAGAVDESIADVLAAAVESHIGAMQPRATVTEQHVDNLPPPDHHRMVGDFEAGKAKLQEHFKGMMAPRTEAEREEREAGMADHQRRAMANLRSHSFANTVSLLEGQEDLYSTVIRSDEVWLVAFVNGERDMAAMPIIDVAAKRLAANARVAVVNYANTDYDLRAAWTVRSDNLPQLRLFSTTGSLPDVIPGLQKGVGPDTLTKLTAAQQGMRAMLISGDCITKLAEHADGKEAKKRGVAGYKQPKSEL